MSRHLAASLQASVLLVCLSIVISPPSVHAQRQARRHAPAIVLDLALPLACTPQWDLSVHRMYKLAYTWTHHHKLLDWTYSGAGSTQLQYKSQNASQSAARGAQNPAREAQNPAREAQECVQLSYRTLIDIPSFFNSYLASHSLPLSVSKRICVSGRHMHERVVFSDLLLVGSFGIDINATIDREPDQLAVETSLEIEVPWYLAPARETVLKHIKQSVAEYIQLLADDLCA
jgi:hypothetical protein